jgi:hypothetical protein
VAELTFPEFILPYISLETPVKEEFDDVDIFIIYKKKYFF